MSEKRTTIVVAGDNGLGEWGEKSVEEMIKRYRDYAQHLVDKGKRILSAPDFAFQIELVRGVHVERTLKVLQEAQPAALQPKEVPDYEAVAREILFLDGIVAKNPNEQEVADVMHAVILSRACAILRKHFPQQ